MPSPTGADIPRTAAAVGVAVGLFGVSFGVLAVASGMTPLLACAMSALVFAGGSQFAAIGVVAAGGSPIAAFASGLLLNVRYAGFGLAVAPRLRGGLLRRALAAQLLIDESAALALAQRDRTQADRAFWWTGVMVFVCWNAGTAIGALAGAAIADPRALGLDAAFPAGFLAILAPLLDGRRPRAAAAAGALIALALVPVAPPGVPVLAAALGVIAGLLLRAEDQT